jgi:hypothetical protein
VKVLGILTVLALLAPQDRENPEYKAWAGFKVGAIAKFQVAVDAGDKRTESVVVYKLVELTKEKAVLDVETTLMEGEKAAKPVVERREIPAKGGDDDARFITAKGDETITVGELKLKCRWVQIEKKGEGGMLHKKRWSCDEVPGHLVKLDTRQEGAAPTVTRMTLTEFSTP